MLLCRLIKRGGKAWLNQPSLQAFYMQWNLLIICTKLLKMTVATVAQKSTCSWKASPTYGLDTSNALRCCEILILFTDLNPQISDKLYSYWTCYGNSHILTCCVELNGYSRTNFDFEMLQSKHLSSVQKNINISLLSDCETVSCFQL